MAVNGGHGSRLTELTNIISENMKMIDDYFAANNLPKLSFDADAPLDFPVPNSNEEIQDARRKVVNATQELNLLMVGPREHIRWTSWSVSTNSSLSSAFKVMREFLVRDVVPRTPYYFLARKARCMR